MRFLHASFLVAYAAIALANAAVGSARYSVLDLGIGDATGINSSGQIAARLQSPSGNFDAYLSQTKLPTLGGDSGSGDAVNGSGHVAGSSNTSVGGYEQACLWRNGTATNLGNLGGRRSAGSAINDYDQVAGYSETNLSGSMGNKANHAILWQNGTLYDLGTLQGPDSYATGINNSGTVVGYSQGSYGNLHTVIWQNRAITDLGTMGGIQSMAYAINVTGQIAGTYETYNTANNYHAFLYDSGHVTDLGTIGGKYDSLALGINDAGNIVGYSTTANGSEYHAFIWNGGAMQDLNGLIDPGSGWTLSFAEAINNSGQIVGQGTYNGTVGHAFMLMPVPEPSCVLALLLGIGGLAWRRRR